MLSYNELVDETKWRYVHEKQIPNLKKGTIIKWTNASRYCLIIDEQFKHRKGELYYITTYDLSKKTTEVSLINMNSIFYIYIPSIKKLPRNYKPKENVLWI